MSESLRYKEAKAFLYAGANGPIIFALSDGSFAVFDRGSILFGIVEKLHPSFIRRCCSLMQKDYIESLQATEKFRKREGVDEVKKPIKLSVQELEIEL